MAELDPGSNQIEDDFYGDQDVSVEAEVERQNREVEAIRQRHFKVGLREGASEARDSTLQGGFDKGFAAGAKATAEPGFILGVCSVVDSFYSKIESAKKSESIGEAGLSPEEGEKEAFREDLQHIRSSKERINTWLRDAPVESEMDVNDICKVCERIVPFTVPNYSENAAKHLSSSKQNSDI